MVALRKRTGLWRRRGATAGATRTAGVPVGCVAGREHHAGRPPGLQQGWRRWLGAAGGCDPKVSPEAALIRCVRRTNAGVADGRLRCD